MSQNKKYRVIFRGDTAEGEEPEKVRQGVASLLKQDITETEKLFSGKKYVIRTSSEDLETCKKAQEIFRNIGAVCFIEEISVGSSLRFEPTAQKSTEQIKADLDSSYIYIDLEIDADENIYHIGFSSPCLFESYLSKENLTEAYQQLIHLKNQGLSICGHNFRRFDYPYLIRENSDLHPWLVIDTLELSVLAFPLQPSHKLDKEYKPTDYAKNNPLEDARATRILLHKITDAIFELPSAIQGTYSMLLTCGDDDADKAYKSFFNILNINPEQSEIPEDGIKDFNADYLKSLWKNLREKDFDTRFSLAALIAWNYQRHKSSSESIFSGWLAHIPGFWQILENLAPLPSPRDYLERFSVQKFRPLQEGAIQAILDRQSPLIIMPTGSGKSLCYQIPALMLFERKKSLTIVISPLQALMADQIADLEAKGIYFATFINGTLSAEERFQRLKQIREGKKGLLYTSPEQLRSVSIRELLKERPPALWVVDEAHCISHWGHDFRPDYRYIPKFIRELYAENPFPLLVFMTATARSTFRDDIKRLFADEGIYIKCEQISDSIRDNLFYEVIQVNTNKNQVLLHEVKKILPSGGAILIYTTTRNNAENLATMLNQANIRAAYYHGRLSGAEKEEVLSEFKKGELNVITATCAFGMGINRQDVRAVIHHTMSANPEGYIQETGRAGRDGKSATCTLLFDKDDADMIFFLQSFNHLSKTDLENIFLSIREHRNRIFNEASEEWFWLTINEIFRFSDLTHDFAYDKEQIDIKIKVALYHLERFGMVERAENLSALIRFELVHSTEHEAIKVFESYAEANQLSKSQIGQFRRLIHEMYLSKNRPPSMLDDTFPLDNLSDRSGISEKEINSRIRELQKAGVCTFELPLTFLLNKGVRGDARNYHDRIREQEKKLWERILEVINGLEDSAGLNAFHVNLRALATSLDPEADQKIRVADLADIIEGWASQNWIRLMYVSRDMVRLSNIKVQENISQHRKLSNALISVLYEKLSDENGARLRVTFDQNQLLAHINKKTRPFTWIEEDLKAMILWLHQRKIIRITDGLNFVYQALKLRVIKGAAISSINTKKHYPVLKGYYDEQFRRTHIMLKYGQLADESSCRNLINDYFNLPKDEFCQTYPELCDDKSEERLIIEPLDDTQKTIVRADDPAIAVIAVPGSGKTRTIVHRIAYLVKVGRVLPNRILALAYNRNAVRELRIRLQGLLGHFASWIKVYTFHGLALSILGRTVNSNNKILQNTDFEKILKEACDLLKHGNESDDEYDSQVRRIELLGNIEHIFVDEYQDVAEDEYRLIQLVAGLGASDDKSRSVQINLCVIGDDDQNIYEFKGTAPKYIIQFEEEYKAKRFLLTENYRSAQAIITAANHLIQHNSERCKKNPEEQIVINQARKDDSGDPVQSLIFENIAVQASYVSRKIQECIKSGIPANHIAVMARQWDTLSPVRSLLEKIEIPTYALKRNDIKLVRNSVVCQLIETLQRSPGFFLLKNLLKKGFMIFLSINGTAIPMSRLSGLSLK